MAYRYTNTDKWSDSWFLQLKPHEKLLFNYLCDNCDIAGFIELNLKKWAADTGLDIRQIEGACKGLARGLIMSDTGDCYYVRTFLKHQKNLPLNPANKAHIGILKRFDLYSYKFNIHNVTEFIEGALKGLERGLEGASKGLARGTGNGNGIIYNTINNNLNNIDNSTITEGLERGLEGASKGLTKEKSIDNKPDGTWKTSFPIYQKELRKAWSEIITPEYITERERFHPNLDIMLTIEKACKDYWITEAGWINKKASKSNEIDWKATFNNALTLKSNQVWKEKNKFSNII